MSEHDTPEAEGASPDREDFIREIVKADLATADLVRIRGVWVTDRPLTALETAGAMERGSESSTGPYRST